MSVEIEINNMLDIVNETGAMETDFRVCPPVAANATITKWDFKTGKSKSPNGETERPWYAIQFTWDVDSQEARDEIKRDKVLVDQNPVFLTFLENGSLDPENNQTFARLCELFGIETQRVPIRQIFDSFIGQYAFVQVKQRNFQTSTGETGTAANVAAVAKPE